MSDKKVIETSEVTTEVEEGGNTVLPSNYKKKTTVTTEQKIEKDDAPIVIIHQD